MQHLIHLIINEQLTPVWLNPSLPGGRLKDVYGDRPSNDLGLGDKIAINRFINDGRWSSPNPTSGQLMDILHLIHPKENPVIEYNGQISWTASEDGEFIISSAVEILNVQQQPSSWCNTLWFKGKVPKHSIYLWMAINKGLKTKDILLNKIQIADPS